MHYQEFLPDTSLQDYIQYFWVLEDDTDNFSVKSFKIIPDGIPTLIFQEKPNLFFDMDAQAAPQLYIQGQSTKFTEHRVMGNFRIIGVYLQPTALKTIFNIDAFEFNDQKVPLEDIITEPILQQLINAVSLKQKIKIISNFLLKHISKVERNTEKATIASLFLQNGKTLKETQIEMNLSERSLERLIKQYVGMPPKMFSRIMRFQSGLNILRQADFNNLTEIAYQNDYFDQSHYIREFKGFTGTNPERFMLNANEKLLNFPLWDASK